MKKFKTLFKKTSTGAIQYWKLSVDGATIITRYGQVKGKEQETSDTIKEGKNIGRSNETTPEEQALLEAQSQWEQKKKKGYVETIKDATAGKTDAVIEGGVFPMLAHKFSEQGHKITYPCYIQPKLDGIRCTSDYQRNLWSRTRKPITGVPHVSKSIREALPTGQFKLDGELYNHKYKKDFETIVHFVRQEDPTEGHEIVQYHVYDVIAEGKPFIDRLAWLQKYIPEDGTVQLVETIPVNNEEELMAAHEHFLELGYEGTIVRNSNGPYIFKRSYDLQKIKEFDDSEFPIVDIKEGRGKLAGHAIFLCKTTKDAEFEVKMKGSTEKLKEFFNDHSLWKNKLLTVRFQGYTNKNNVPRFPVGIAIRDYE